MKNYNRCRRNSFSNEKKANIGINVERNNYKADKMALKINETKMKIIEIGKGYDNRKIIVGEYLNI